MVPLFIWIISSLSLLPSSICNEFFFMLLLVVIIYVALFFSFVEDSRPSNDLLFSNSKKGIIVLDYKKRFLYANKSAELTFDIIAKGNKDAITAFINVNLIDEDNFFDGFNNYKLILETISDETNPRAGYAVWIEKVLRKQPKETQLYKRDALVLVILVFNIMQPLLMFLCRVLGNLSVP